MRVPLLLQIDILDLCIQLDAVFFLFFACPYGSRPLCLIRNFWLVPHVYGSRPPHHSRAADLHIHLGVLALSRALGLCISQTSNLVSSMRLPALVSVLATPPLLHRPPGGPGPHVHNKAPGLHRTLGDIRSFARPMAPGPYPDYSGRAPDLGFGFAPYATGITLKVQVSRLGGVTRFLFFFFFFFNRA